MEESVMNADQNVALDIHVEKSDRTVTVDQEVDINSTKSLSCRSIWILIPYTLSTIKILCQNLCITCSTEVDMEGIDMETGMAIEI